MLKIITRNAMQTLSFGWVGPKRPAGPSYFELKDEPLDDEVYACLEYPCKLSEKYGDFTYIQTADQYIVTGPEGFQHILKSNAKNYIKGNYYYKRIRSLFGHSLLTGDGEYWRQRRKVAQPSFHHTMIKRYVPSILSGVQSFIDEYSGGLAQSQAKKNKITDQPLNVLTLMNHLTLNISLQLFTGKTLDPATLKKLSTALYFANYYVSHAWFISPWKPTFESLLFFHYMRRIDKILLTCIREQRAHPSDEDHLLNALLKAKDETTHQYLNDQEILAEFKTLLLTGHETTGCALTWMWYLLAKNPSWRLSLERELQKTLGGRMPSLEDLTRMPILQGIFQETLRLYPPIWSFARSNVEPDILYGYKMPKKSLIVLNIYALQRNPKYWHNPDEFNPLRFMGSNLKNIDPYTYLPFSTGPRTCIASQLGTQEALLIMAALVQHFRFDTCRKTKVVLEPCISLRPKNGLWMTQVPR